MLRARIATHASEKTNTMCKFLQTFCCLKCAYLIVFILICSLYSNRVSAQSEMHLAGIANAPLASNPASAGRTGAINAVAAFRQQWVGFSGSPQTTLIAADAEVKFLRNFHGVGALAYRDAIGPLTSTNICMNYSFHAELDNGLLGIGARVGAHNVAFTPSELRPSVEGFETDYHQASDPLLQGGDESGTALDLGVGAFFQTKKSYLSLSVLHVNAPLVRTKAFAAIRLRPVLTLAAARKVAQWQKVELEPRIHCKTDFASWQIEASGTLIFNKRVYGGLGFRLQDALFFEIGANLFDSICVGYYYDLNLSKLKRYNYGSHEITLSYTFSVDVEKRVKRYKSVRIL